MIKFIYWFAYYNLDSPSVRYRGFYPLNFAKDQFSIPNYFVYPKYSLRHIIKFAQAYFSALFFRKENSIIVIQRVQSNFIYANLLKLLVLLRKEGTIYDLDDADYLVHSPKTMHFFARNCESIAAGSQEILHYMKRFNENTFHVTSPTPDLRMIKMQRNKQFTIGWIGGYGWGHKDSLMKSVFPAIKRLKFDCKLILIGIMKQKDIEDLMTYFKNSPQVTLEIPTAINWNDEKELQSQICAMDVGIATLLDHPIQLAKSGIKAKQYMNNAVPVLSTDLPENNNVVVNGFNGLLCSSVEEFERGINTFKHMSDEEYTRFSSNARNSIVHFNHHKYLNEFNEIGNTNYLVGA